MTHNFNQSNQSTSSLLSKITQYLLSQSTRNTVFTWSVFGLTAILLAIMAWIFGQILFHGLSEISWSFLTTNPVNSGREGGIASILLTTGWVLVIAMSITLPLGLATSLWLSEFKSKQYSPWVSKIIYILAGVPSIVYGLFGNAFFCVYLDLGYSILSGGLTLATMILPYFIQTCVLGFELVDNRWRLGAQALGLSKATFIVHILLPQAAPAIAAGLILSIGRATAETAALLFTSGFVDRTPESWLDSGRTLSVHIYDLAMNITGGESAAYGTALVLIIVLLGINTLAHRLLRSIPANGVN